MNKHRFILSCLFILSWLSSFWLFVFMAVLGIGRQRVTGITGFVIAIIIMVLYVYFTDDDEDA